MKPNVLKYLQLLKKSIQARLNLEFQLEDYILDELDLLWYSLTPEEVDEVNQLIDNTFLNLLNEKDI